VPVLCVWVWTFYLIFMYCFHICWVTTSSLNWSDGFEVLCRFWQGTEPIEILGDDLYWNICHHLVLQYHLLCNITGETDVGFWFWQINWYAFALGFGLDKYWCLHRVSVVSAFIGLYFCRTIPCKETWLTLHEDFTDFRQAARNRCWGSWG